MTVSCACLTYGRNELLAAAVACFIRQDWPDKELVVFNTLPSQQLWCAHPQVRVINHKPRPQSLGATRNLCVEACRGELVLTWDDDNLYLPHYIRWLAERIGNDAWIRQGSRFSMERGVITGIHEQAVNQFMFRKSAWQAVNGYSEELDSGEDADFHHRLSARLHGRKVECPQNEIGFLYGWANGAFHVSGCGVNQPGKMTAWAQAKRHVERLPQRRGRVEIVPAFSRTGEEAVRLYQSRTKKIVVP